MRCDVRRRTKNMFKSIFKQPEIPNKLSGFVLKKVVVYSASDSIAKLGLKSL